MEQGSTPAINHTISKTLMTARLIDGFWDRWIVHGVDKRDLAKLVPHLISKEKWIDCWSKLALEKLREAECLNQKGAILEAETLFRTAGLYFQLVQWLLTERTEEKEKWLDLGINAFYKADQLSTVQIQYELIEVEGFQCFGRVRIPLEPKGVIVFINPIDSTKEELFTYEMDYIAKGYITISFDGPGQGETYVRQGLKATKTRWRHFVDRLIHYTHDKFPQYSMYLFGTSSGAAWTLYGSCSPFVSKAVAISPAFMNEGIPLPDYFSERMSYFTESETNILPNLQELVYRNPVLLVHGNKDVMVSNENIYELFKVLSEGKQLLEYEEEGHCCNYKLKEIRQVSVDWFHKGDVEI